MTLWKLFLYFLEELSPASDEDEIVSLLSKNMSEFPTDTRGGSCDEDSRHKKMDL
jgi:hypothetical protein